MNHYKKKQFSIFSVFLLIVAVLIIGGYFLFRAESATCFDGIQNQGEEDVDCGGPCGACEEPRDLKIISQGFIPTEEGNFDFVAKIENPNPDWGVEFLRYRFYMYDQNDEQIGFKEGKTYVLPQETKYLIEQRIGFPKLGRINLEIRELIWQKIKDFEEIEIRIRNKELKITEQGFNKLVGNVENKSSYDLDKIEINGLLYNGGRLVGAGKTTMNTVLMGETRYFEISWPYEIIDEITSFELKPHTNIYLNDNFLKTHGTEEKFKEY